jgi:hypothetical protein
MRSTAVKRAEGGERGVKDSSEHPVDVSRPGIVLPLDAAVA